MNIFFHCLTFVLLLFFATNDVATAGPLETKSVKGLVSGACISGNVGSEISFTNKKGDNNLSRSSRIKAGEEVYETHETIHPYSRTAGVWERKLSWPNASYISVHFAAFDLAADDYVEISSPDGKYNYRYEGKGKVVRGGAATLSRFWASHIPGDTAIIRFYTVNPKGGYGFRIDKWVHGYAPEALQGGNTEAICGTDDKEWAPCYNGTTIYEQGRKVARLLIQGSWLCTGWLLGSESHLMTNNHCIGSQSDANNTDYEFMAEGATCMTNCPQMQCPGTVEATSGTLIQTDTALDYTLIKLPTDLTSKYGYLKARDVLPDVQERIYIPQHPGGKGKQIAVNDTRIGGYCEVHSTTQSPCIGGSGDIGYYCDTEGGSSGSPVLAYNDHCVVALHHCAYCPNRGVRLTEVITDLGGNVPANAVSPAGTSCIITDSSLTLSPASGDYVSTQRFDLTLIVEAVGVSVIGLNATLDGKSVTTPLQSCVISGTLISGGETFRCPNILAGSILGVGTHTLNVTVDLSDGSSVNDEVSWNVLENEE